MSLLGKTVATPTEYAPELLDPIPRTLGRDSLGMKAALPFHGEDVWHAWELGWRRPDGGAAVAVARLRVPADSENMVESKSLKLYLHSLNSKHCTGPEEVAELIARDLAPVIGSAVQVEVLDQDDPGLQPSVISGLCIDELAPASIEASPGASMLQACEHEGEQVLVSHLLRSLCPVTGQPDWASVVLRSQGRGPDRASLLSYLLSFHDHQEFHEQCVERIFCDVLEACRPDELSVQALYTRRGGLDINPFRSTRAEKAPLLRTGRQ